MVCSAVDYIFVVEHILAEDILVVRMVLVHKLVDPDIFDVGREARSFVNLFVSLDFCSRR